jgi:integrase
MNTLREEVRDYSEMRRSLGFKLRETGKLLSAFIRFLEEHRSSFFTTQLALAWPQQPSIVQPAEWAHRLSVVRTFARYRSATDPRTQVPPPSLLPFQPKRARPYLYSEEEIRSLLHATLRMPYRSQCGKLRPWTFYCLFGLLSVTGLRLGEARNLELSDVDLKTGVLTIRGAKFGKTRLVPLHASTCAVLANYLTRRQRHWAGRTVSFHLFLSSWGNRLDVGEIHRAFYALSRRIELRGPSDSRGPRLHDMRHRFATNTLRRAGVPYFSLYELRHTFATRLSSEGMADHFVTLMLRQGDAGVFKRYSQAKLNMMREALDRLDRQANEHERSSGTARPN